MVFSHTTGLQGDMLPMKGNVFAVRWDDRTIKADALANFRTGLDGSVSGMTMAPLSPTVDFSFDFQDLDFTKVAARRKPANALGVSKRQGEASPGRPRRDSSAALASSHVMSFPN
jgi:hypothetical protein